MSLAKGAVSLSGLSQINLELSSRCNKTVLCAFCGHQDANINPGLVYGDIEFSLLERVRSQLTPGIVVQFHRDGEPTVYPRLRDALSLFSGFVTSVVTHGENLVRRANDLINLCTTLTVSVFRGDPDGPMQFEIVKEFLRLKGVQSPMVLIKIVGDYPNSPWEDLHVPIIRRLIHQPTGNTKYAHHAPTIPEVGICLDALHHPSIDWRGRVFLCNRLDPADANYLGSLREQSLESIWNGERRRVWVLAHSQGRRDLASDLCKTCTFYGVPSEA